MTFCTDDWSRLSHAARDRREEYFNPSRSFRLTECQAINEQRLGAEFYDPLTGLPNRAFFQRRRHTIEHQLNVRRNSNSIYAIAFLQLEIPPALAQSSLRLAFLTLAKQVQAICWQPNLMARLGERTMAVLFDQLEWDTDANVLLEEIYQRTSRQLWLEGCSTPVQVEMRSMIARAGRGQLVQLL